MGNATAIFEYFRLRREEKRAFIFCGSEEEKQCQQAGAPEKEASAPGRKNLLSTTDERERATLAVRELGLSPISSTYPL